MHELWTEAVRSIEPMIKPAHRDLWLRPIECVGIGDGRIRLRAPNRYSKEWFEDNFLPSILKDLEAKTHQVFEVDFEIGEEPATPPPSAPREGLEVRHAVTSAPAPRPVAIPVPGPDLVQRYTF